MLEQLGKVKTSSTKRKTGFKFPCWVSSGTPLPENMEVKVDSDADSASAFPPYAICGTLKWETADNPKSGLALATERDEWIEPPHVALANLRIDDPQSVMAFMGRYGVLEGTFRTEEDQTKFEVQGWEFWTTQGTLRSAWNGESGEAWNVLESLVEENIAADVVPAYGSVDLRVRDLWTFVAFLFLMDSPRGKLGVCHNPDCPAPYFQKKRITQKFCEAGPCVAYAQRQHALRYWNTKGKKRRKEQAKAKTKRKR
jgi:hypothetical protein